MTTPRIAIIGAGPGGLTLARILHSNGVSAVVYEGDSSPDSRPQGGTLDMHPVSGQFALQQAGLFPAFQKIARYEDQGGKFYNKHGQLLAEDAWRDERNSDGQPEDRPEIDRMQLRQLFLDALPLEMVQWDHSLQMVRPLESGQYEIQFANSRQAIADLIVGADGAWSRVRPLVSSATPIYSGVTFVELGLDRVDECFPDIAEMVGHGTMVAEENGKMLFAQRNSGGHIKIYAGLRVPEDWARTGGLDLSSSAAAIAGLLAYYEGWSDKLLRLITEARLPITPRPIYALPVGHRWENRPGVTLLGDAAHLMSPFGGQGANLAMQDGAELALALIGAQDWRAAVQSYEQAMFARSEIAAAFAKEGVDRSGDSDLNNLPA